MNVFESTTKLYEVSTQYTLEHIIIDDSKVRKFVQTVGLLQDTDGFEDDGTVAQLSLLRYWYSNCPLPTNAAMYGDHILTSRLLSIIELGERREFQFPKAIGEAIDLLEDVWSKAESPILAEVYELVEQNPEANICLLVRQRNWVEAVQKQVSSDGYTNLRVIAPTDVSQPETYDVMIVIGNHHRYPDHVFTAPRARNVVVVSYAWQGMLRDFHPSFLDAQIEPITTKVRIKTSSGMIPASLPSDTAVTDDSFLEARLKSHYMNTDDDGLSSVPGRLTRLFGDFSVFLDASGDPENLIIDPELDGDLRKAKFIDIKPGMYVVLRSDTGSNHIEEAADIILGTDAMKYRKSIRDWKAKLRIKVTQIGPDEASKALQSMGIRHATENNIRNWCSNRSIATRWKLDFGILMEFIGLEEETDSLWAAAKAVRDTHLTAGMRISKQLKRLIKEHDSATLAQQGRIDFEHPTFGGARLSAFQIESISPTETYVSENNLLRLLDPSEG